MENVVEQIVSVKKVSKLKGRKRSPEFVAKMKAWHAAQKAMGKTVGRPRKEKSVKPTTTEIQEAYERVEKVEA